MYRQGSQTTDPDGVSWEKKHKRFKTYGTVVVGQNGAYIWPKDDGTLRMVGPGGIEFSHQTGSGLVVMQNSPTIITPTIANFTNSQHNHEDAAGGGLLASEAQGGIASFEIDQLGDLGWDAVHAWNLDETSGDRADQIGGITLTDTNTVTSAAGLHGGSLKSAVFTAANSEHLIKYNGPSTLFPILGKDWQIAFWFRTTTIAAGDRYVYTLRDAAGTIRGSIRLAADQLSVVVHDSTATTRSTSAGAGWLRTNTPYPARVWYNDLKRQVVVQVGYAPSIRVNNTIGWGHTAVLTGGPIVPSAFNLIFGSRTVEFWDGQMDSIVISNGPNAIWSDKMWERYCRGDEYPFDDQWRYGDVARGAKTVLAAKLLLDMSTTGSDASNLYTVTVAKNAATTLFSKTTNGAEITAGTVWDLGAPAVSALADGDYLSMRVTKTGTPTDIRLARGRLVVQYEAA